MCNLIVHAVNLTSTSEPLRTDIDACPLKDVLSRGEMTEFAPRWRRSPVDLRRALQRNRFSHVYQVVGRAVLQERAKLNLRPMDADVPHSGKAIKHWTKSIKNIPVPDGRIHRPHWKEIQVSSISKSIGKIPCPIDRRSNCSRST